MNDCPAEVWSRIFSFACTDDGRTGRSLASVNRYIYQTSRDVTLQTVHLSGLKQIRSFVRMLERAPTNAKKVRHLYVSTDAAQPAHEMPTRERMFEFLYGYGASCNRIPEISTEDHHDDTVAASLLRLLVLVAPNLLTLNLAMLKRDNILLPISLPQLVELRLHGPFPSWSVDDPTVSPFPRLRSLSLSGFYEYPMTLFSCISRLTPFLTELNLAPEKPSRLVHIDLQVALSHVEDPEHHIRRLPQTLKRVTIRPSDPPGEDKYWLVPVYQDMIKGIHEMSTKDRRVSLTRDERDFDESRRIWIDCAV